MKNFKGLILFILLLCLTTSIFAATTPTAFDLQQANQTLLQLNQQLTKKENKLPQLETAISTLGQFQLQAKTCTINIQNALTTVNREIEISSKVANLKTLPADQKFLEQKKNILTAQLSDCRLFLLQSKDLLDKYNAAAHQMAARTLLTAEPNIIAKISGNIATIKELPQQFNKSIFIEFSGIELFNFQNLTFFCILLIVVIFITYRLKKTLNAAIAKATKPRFGSQLNQAFLCSLNYYLFPLTIFLLVALFSTVLGATVKTWPIITLCSYGLLIYPMVMVFLKTFFHPPKPAHAITQFPKNLNLSLLRRLRSLLQLVLVGYFTYILMSEQTLAAITVSLARTIFISLLAINLITIVWLINRAPKIIYLPRFFRSCLSFILSIVLLSILLTEWLGYHAIANYLLIGISLTLLFIFIAWLLQKISTACINMLSDERHPWQQHWRLYLGIKKHQTIPELIWLRIVTHLIIWGGFAIALLKIWGISKVYFQKLLNALMNGFVVAQFSIVPSHILLALLLFTALTMVTRWLRARVSHYPGFESAPGARDALAAIVGYIGFTLALIFSLLLAGVNFAGIAIVAGALSVGIGFGLQNIVNNFVSGIILLIERPIKVGDRIIVGGTEGYVRKISIRSTQIETSQKSDVMIPNSELISQQVINLMYHNHYSRLALPISVAYGTNTELLKSVLLDIANAHPIVISDYPANEAKVEFKQFGVSSLDFELSCLIKDVTEQGKVKSDLLFSIDAAFRNNNIELAAPRREIYLHKD
jgi:potassium efflux system protein